MLAATSLKCSPKEQTSPIGQLTLSAAATMLLWNESTDDSPRLEPGKTGGDVDGGRWSGEQALYREWLQALHRLRKVLIPGKLLMPRVSSALNAEAKLADVGAINLAMDMTKCCDGTHSSTSMSVSKPPRNAHGLDR
jgi:hypothetical protein